jgi:hypothetical protein
MAFMTFDRMYPLPVAAMPLRNLAEAHESPAVRLPREAVTASYVAHLGDVVWLVSCTAVEKVSTAVQGQRGTWGGPAGRPLQNQRRATQPCLDSQLSAACAWLSVNLRVCCLSWLCCWRLILWLLHSKVLNSINRQQHVITVTRALSVSCLWPCAATTQLRVVPGTIAGRWRCEAAGAPSGGTRCHWSCCWALRPGHCGRQWQRGVCFFVLAGEQELRDLLSDSCRIMARGGFRTRGGPCLAQSQVNLLTHHDGTSLAQAHAAACISKQDLWSRGTM